MVSPEPSLAELPWGATEGQRGRPLLSGFRALTRRHTSTHTQHTHSHAHTNTHARAGKASSDGRIGCRAGVLVPGGPYHQCCLGPALWVMHRLLKGSHLFT